MNSSMGGTTAGDVVNFWQRPKRLVLILILIVSAGCAHLSVRSNVSVTANPQQQGARGADVTPAIINSKFAEPLICVGGTCTSLETEALRQAVQVYERGLVASSDDFRALESFLLANPKSPWRATLQLNMGLLYRKTGYCGKSLASLKESWNLLKASTSVQEKALADRALGEYCSTLCYLGRYETLAPLLKEVKSRSLTGSATEWVTQSWEGLHQMQVNPQKSFRCGPLALSKIYSLYFGSSKAQAQTLIEECRSTSRGTSLAQVFRLSERCKMNYQMAYRSPGSAVVVPAVIHWKEGHFGALLEKSDSRYRVEDSTNIFTPLHVTSACLDQESSGYYLVPSGDLPSGWRSASFSEASAVWGRGVPPGSELSSTTTCDTKGFNNSCGSCGMTTWNVHSLLTGLTLEDTPVGLSPAAFSIPFVATYAHREAFQPAVFGYCNLGPKWNFNWLSYVHDDIWNSGGRAQLHEAGGGRQAFSFPKGSPTPSGYATVSRLGFLSPGILIRVPDPGDPTDHLSLSFKREWPDGSVEIYDKRFNDKVFLTKKIDPQGNTTQVVYDSQMRITSITDPVNRVTTLSYGLAQDPLKITEVTDPFGRTAHFSYTSDGHLSGITDVLGLTSSYTYGSNDFITTLTTPYGTTAFAYADSSTNTTLAERRILTATDPNGRNYRAETRNNCPGIPFSERAVPTGLLQFNQYINSRNGCSWTPTQLAGGVDYTKATIHHFLHTRDDLYVAGRLVESIKKPLENRVWMYYKDMNPELYGNVSAAIEGKNQSNLPTHVARLLGDGTTQLTRYAYSDKGNRTQSIDPSGRVFNYSYAPNGQDLISITTGGQTLMSATYDGNHNIVSVTSASGGTSTYTYDSRGQILTASNELGETTAYSYTLTGNLASIQSPLNAVTTFGYNGQEQLVSATDSEGYTVTAQYDAADRPISVSYPDGTTETITYDRLDVASTKDRKDRVTTLQHDAVRRLRQVLDANGGTTTLGYGLEDSPNLLTDPSGRQTAFAFDLQQRLITKQYAGGATQTNTWCECGRLESTTDALGHSKNLQYFLDNMLKGIDYSGTTPDVTFTADTFLPRPLSMTDGQGTTTYTYVPVGSPGGNGLASVTGPIGDSAVFSYDLAGRMTGRTVNGASETQNFDALWRTTSTTNALDTFNMSYLGTTGQVTGVNSTLGPSMQYTYGTNIADRRLAQIKNLGRTGQTLSQFDFTTNPVGEITRIVETHGGATGTPTPTPTTTPPDDDDDDDDEEDDDHHHGKHRGHGHDKDHKGNHGKGHHNGGNHGNDGHNGNKNKNKDKGKDKHGSVFFLPDSDDMRTGTTALVLTLCGLLMVSTLAQPRSRRTLVAQLTSVGLMGTLALQGCLVGGGGTPTGSSETRDYAYDNLSQLVGVNINQTPAASFSFDPAGNLLSLTAGNTTTGFTYNALNQRTTPGTNLYDAKGQTTDQAGRTFEWDDDGRMTAIVMGTHRSEFQYNGIGKRVRITEKDGATVTSDKLYWWIGRHIVCERDAMRAGNPITKRYFGAGVVVGTEKLYYTLDQLGSVRELIDSSGAVRSDYRYSTYGERTKEAGDLESDFGYAGLFHHGPSGLDLATYRAYDSAQGRWISRDPLGEGVDYNLYRYAGNNPVSFSDPDGLQPNVTDYGNWQAVQPTRINIVPGALGAVGAAGSLAVGAVGTGATLAGTGVGIVGTAVSTAGSLIKNAVGPIFEEQPQGKHGGAEHPEKKQGGGGIDGKDGGDDGGGKDGGDDCHADEDPFCAALRRLAYSNLFKRRLASGLHLQVYGTPEANEIEATFARCNKAAKEGHRNFEVTGNYWGDNI